MNGIRRVLSVLGPGIFAIGYTIGTGSVTSMAAPTFVTRPLLVEAVFPCDRSWFMKVNLTQPLKGRDTSIRSYVPKDS